MALHPNRYNRTSEAYDFTLFEGKELEDKYTVHRKSKELAVGTGTGKEESRLQTQSKAHVYRIKKQRNRAKTFRIVVSCFLLINCIRGYRFYYFQSGSINRIDRRDRHSCPAIGRKSKCLYSTSNESKCKFIFGNS